MENSVHEYSFFNSIDSKELPTDIMYSSVLHSECCCLLDTLSEVYLWKGSATSDELQKQAMAFASQVVKTRKNRPTWVNVTPIEQDAEPWLWKVKFSKWAAVPASLTLTSVINYYRDSIVNQTTEDN